MQKRLRPGLTEALAGLALCSALAAAAADPPEEPKVAATLTLASPDFYVGMAQPEAPSHALALALAYFPAAGWTPQLIVDTARTAARLLAQCGVLVSALEVHRIEGGPRYAYYATARSRELARRIPLKRPAVYFVADTLQRPAFEAEAVGRANSRSRPELADTVWVTRGARDLGIVLAHELVHVLMDSGEHVDEPGNLMQDETDPRNTRLEASQCARVRETGNAHGLLTPLRRAH